ncbi:MAG: hypothetical protein MJK18_10380, partial [Bdellovibrionales bacterium]|nr:hypothetical protein [Bdellovibrionales bacterium]
MRILLIISILFLFSTQGQASRLIEIEDYYSKKTTEFVQTRYPKKAFTVYVKVEAESDGEKRQPADVGQRKSLSLPYLNSVNGDQVDFWTRKDLALGTLISYLKSVYVKIDIDGQFSDAEAEQFKTQVFQHLKLSPVYDKVEMSQRVWSQSKEQKQRNLILGVGAVLLCIAFVMLFVVFQSGIRTLVKGIAGPLSDIGKSTENFAKQPMASGGGRSFTPALSASWQEDTLADSKVETIKKQIKEVEDIFQQPNGVLLRSIEDYGAKYPHAMGAIFRELDSENVKSLFRLGTGDWWYKAITQASSLNQKSAQIVTVVSQLKMRLELSQHKESENEDVVMLGL